MGFFGRASKTSARVLWLLGASLCVFSACAGSQPKQAAEPEDDADKPPPACHKDEVREYFCDDLLPLKSEKPAPDPYSTCPGQLEVKGSVFPATSSLSRFDPARTEWTRKRVPPGHSCCYSWCSKLASVAASDVDQSSCQKPNAMKEKLCVSEAEAGVSDGAEAPNQLCASAIAPPPGVSFAAPKAAGLDLQATAERRGQGLKECCYGWCSQAPLGTGLGAK